MKKLSVLILFVFTFVLLSFLSPKVASATVLFQDDFNDGDADGWMVIGTPGWTVKNNEYGILINPNFTISDTIPTDDNWKVNGGDYIYEVDLRGVSGTDKNLLFRFQDPGNWYGIHHGLGRIYFEKIVGGVDYSYLIPSISYPLSNGVIYHFKIILQGRQIKIYVDDKIIFDFIDPDPALETGKIGIRAGTGAVAPTEVWFDNVVVRSLEEEKEPLILLPGLGGSWNFETIIKGRPSEQKDWYMTPFVKVYGGLIQSLQNAGYGLNTNLFIFNYDWTKQADLIADDLKNYIDNVVDPPEGTEIDLVGHSLGGLVARTYVQNDPNNSVSQLITVGSPHQGTTQVYYAWEGANLNKVLPGWQRIPAGILFWRGKSPFENLVPSLQSLCPVLKNLLPSSPYLKKERIPVPIENMIEKNDWLISLNNTVPLQLLEILKSSLGNAVDTVKWIEVEDRNRLDEILERWVDGRPTGNEEFSPGDNRVITENAVLPGLDPSHIEELNLNHGDLVKTKEGQRAILDFLGLSLLESEIIPAPEIVYEPSLVFQLASPATIRVTDPSGRSVGFEAPEPLIPDAFFDSDEKLIFIPNPEDGNYQIEIFPEGGGGEYRLLVGLLTENGDYWREYQGGTTPGSPDEQIFFSPSPEELKFYLLSQGKTVIFSLKKDFNKQKIPVKFRGRIESKLAVALGNINAALELLEEGDAVSGKRKIERALMEIFELEEFLESENIPPLLKEFFSEALKEIEDYLLQLLAFY